MKDPEKVVKTYIPTILAPCANFKVALPSGSRSLYPLARSRWCAIAWPAAIAVNLVASSANGLGMGSSVLK